MHVVILAVLLFACESSALFNDRRTLMVTGICGGILAGCLYYSTPEPVFLTADDIPTIYYTEKKQIDAVVVKILDGDTYRVRHITSRQRNPKFQGKISDNTIVVRIAAVDTPETAKFGR